jgi:hypothetical protein
MAEDAANRNERAAPLISAQRHKRAFNIDITRRPLCGGTMRVMAEGSLAASLTQT